MRRTHSIVIADDHPILREGLSEQLNAEGDFAVLDAVGDAQSAVDACRARQPDALLLDIEMPGRDAIGAMEDVRSCSPDTRVVVLTAYCRHAVIDAAIQAGARGFLLKSDAPSAIVDALRAVTRGETAYSKDVQLRFVRDGNEYARMCARRTRLSALTPRELEVLRYIGHGQDNAQMAAVMHLSIRTVERHVQRLMQQLGVHDRSRLTALAHESGLVG